MKTSLARLPEVMQTQTLYIVDAIVTVTNSEKNCHHSLLQADKNPSSEPYLLR